MERLKRLPRSSVFQKVRIERVRPLGPLAVELHRLAVLLEPSAQLGDGLRPGSLQVDRVARDFAVRIPRLEPVRRLAIQHERIAAVGDREGAERGDVERLADVGQSPELRPPPQRRGCDHRQHGQDGDTGPPLAPADPAKRHHDQPECREAPTHARQSRHLHPRRSGFPTGSVPCQARKPDLRIL